MIMPFKVGDVVMVNPDPIVLRNTEYFNPREMLKFAGAVTSILSVHRVDRMYRLKVDDGDFVWSGDALVRVDDIMPVLLSKALLHVTTALNMVKNIEGADEIQGAKQLAQVKEMLTEQLGGVDNAGRTNT
jgi:hypothetical protein